MLTKRKEKISDQIEDEEKEVDSITADDEANEVTKVMILTNSM